MKKSLKILIFIMAFAFMGVLNVRAACADYGTVPDCTARPGCSWNYSTGCTGTEEPVITCQNKAYNGESQVIATCTGGTINNASQTNVGMYDVTCGTATARCEITKAYPFSGGIDAITVKVGNSATIPSNKKNICSGSLTYTSGDNSVATVSGTTVTGRGVGETTITVHYAGDANCNSKDDFVTIYVEAATPIVKTNPTITGATDRTVTQTGTVNLSLEANVAGTFSCTAPSPYLTMASNCSSFNVTSLDTNNVVVGVGWVFTPSDRTRYNTVDGTFNITLKGTGNSSAVDKVEAAHAIVAVTPADGTVPNTFTAKDASGKSTQVKWTVTGEGITYTCPDNTTSCTVNFENMGTDCTPKTREVTVKATDSANNTKETKVTVYSYQNWSEHNTTGIVPADAHNPTGMKYQTGCVAYDVTDKGLTYHKYYNRCCGGPPQEQPKCFNCNGTYNWGLPSENKTCKEVSYIQDKDSCKPETPETPACYKCNGKFDWGKHASDSSCVFYSNNEADCEEKPYCYKNVDTGEYDYNKHANDPKWVYISENEADCQKEPEQEEPACYSKGDDYAWGKYKDVPGYTFTSLTEAQCNKFCYEEKSTGKYVWGNYVGNNNYEVVASITDESKCKISCYKCDDEVKWGPYADDDSCEEVPGVSTKDDCKVTPPPTGLSVSNILYACGAFLVIMGSGIVVYQLTRVKKEFN